MSVKPLDVRPRFWCVIGAIELRPLNYDVAVTARSALAAVATEGFELVASPAIHKPILDWVSPCVLREVGVRIDGVKVLGEGVVAHLIEKNRALYLVHLCLG